MPNATLRMLQRLIDDTHDNLDAVRHLHGDERDQVVADFEEELAKLRALQISMSPIPNVTDPSVIDDLRAVVAEVRLQASWSNGNVVVWAAGPGMPPENNAELADRLETIGGPALGWNVHPSVVLPSGAKADALSIPVREALGWLVDVAAEADDTDRDEDCDDCGIGASVIWLGRVALEGVRHVAQGRIVPTLHVDKRSTGRQVDAEVRWLPAMVDEATIKRFASMMPGPVAALSTADARATTFAVLGAVVHAIVTEAAARMDLPAPPPTANNAAQVSEAFITRLAGTTFQASPAPLGDVARRIEYWTRSVTRSSRPKLVVQLSPPDSGNAWLLSILAPDASGKLLPIDVTKADTANRQLLDEVMRLERTLSALRSGELRRGQSGAQSIRSLGADDSHGRDPARGWLRRSGPGALATQANPGAAPLHRDCRRDSRRRPPAQRRAVVGVVRRCRIDRGRDRSPGERGPTTRPVPRPVGRTRSRPT